MRIRSVFSIAELSPSQRATSSRLTPKSPARRSRVCREFTRALGPRGAGLLADTLGETKANIDLFHAAAALEMQPRYDLESTVPVNPFDPVELRASLNQGMVWP